MYFLSSVKLMFIPLPFLSKKKEDGTTTQKEKQNDTNEDWDSSTSPNSTSQQPSLVGCCWDVLITLPFFGVLMLFSSPFRVVMVFSLVLRVWCCFRPPPFGGATSRALCRSLLLGGAAFLPPPLAWLSITKSYFHF